MEGLEEYPSSRETISVMLLQPKQAPPKPSSSNSKRKKISVMLPSFLSISVINSASQAHPRQATYTKTYISSEARLLRLRASKKKACFLFLAVAKDERQRIISVMLLQPIQAPPKTPSKQLQEEENFCNASEISVHFCNKPAPAKPTTYKRPKQRPIFRAKQDFCD